MEPTKENSCFLKQDFVPIVQFAPTSPPLSLLLFFLLSISSIFPISILYFLFHLSISLSSFQFFLSFLYPFFIIFYHFFIIFYNFFYHFFIIFLSFFYHFCIICLSSLSSFAAFVSLVLFVVCFQFLVTLCVHVSIFI